MAASLPKLEESIQVWLKGAEEQLLGLASRDSILEQKLLLDEALTDQQHTLFTLPSRYSLKAFLHPFLKCCLLHFTKASESWRTLMLHEIFVFIAN